MDFKNHLLKYLSEKEIEDLVASFSLPENKGLYLNTNKISKEKFESMFPHVKRHHIVENGYLFDQNEYQFGKKVYHEFGAYYIQDPSAMLVSYFLDPKPGQKILDLCAAPGGKSVQASLLMRNEGILYSNDLSRNRANVLLSNVERLGLGNVIVSSIDFSKCYKEFLDYFDAIILDAPCSGSGMFRKLESMKDDWTFEKVLKNACIQKDLISMCYSMLKPGGTLMYSTCSYSYEEDEEIVKFLLENTDAIIENLPEYDGFYRSKDCPQAIHLFPSRFCGEGHFIAKFKKPGILTSNKSQKWSYTKKVESKGGKQVSEIYELNYEPHKLLEKYAMRNGLFIGTKIDKEIIPSHHYSHFTNSDEKTIELTKEEVVKYLRGESLIKNSLENGYYFVSYLSMNIGVVHLVNGIIKNLYPKGLRINSHIDDSF